MGNELFNGFTQLIWTDQKSLHLATRGRRSSTNAGHDRFWPFSDLSLELDDFCF